MDEQRDPIPEGLRPAIGFLSPFRLLGFLGDFQEDGLFAALEEATLDGQYQPVPQATRGRMTAAANGPTGTQRGQSR